MKKTFNFGKVRFNNNRKENLVTVDIKLTDDGCFTASGMIWNRIQTDCIAGGQCLDTIKECLPNNKTFNQIYNIWKLYHLNDMTAGSPKQNDVIDKYFNNNPFPHDYDLICMALKSIDLLEDKSFIHKDKPYRYGSAWLKTEIPPNIIKQVYGLMA